MVIQMQFYHVEQSSKTKNQATKSISSPKSF